MIPWTEKIYDMTPEELLLYKSAFIEDYNTNDDTKNSAREVVNIFYIEYQYYQVRKNHAWVEEQFKLSGDKMAIRREILMQRFRGTEDSPVPQETLEYLISNMIKSTNDLIINGRWRYLLYDHDQNAIYGTEYMPFDKNIPYLIGIDPSSGGGKDYFAVTIVNPFNLKIAAQFRSKYMPGPEAVRMLVTLIEEYIPKGVLIPERNNLGVYLIQMILEESSIADNLYWAENIDAIEELTEENPGDRALQSLSESFKKFGVYTTPKVRGVMFELLFRHISETLSTLTPEYLVEDLCQLERNKTTGKIAAISGGHDDILMSYLATIYVWHMSDNLLLFGIDKDIHPVLEKVQDNVEEVLERKSKNNTVFDITDETSFENIVRLDTVRNDMMVKELVTKLSFVHDEVFSKETATESDNSLPSWMFMQYNNIDDI